MLTRIPWRLIGYVALALLLVFGANNALRFIPFTPQWSAARTAAKAERLEGQVSTLVRAATGQAEIEKAKDTFHTREIIYREIQSQADQEARLAPDADTPLPDERLARHLRNDERVCDGAAFTCSTLDAPLGGVGAVPTDDVTG